MRFLLEQRSDVAASISPYRVVDEQGREIEWANRFLDLQKLRGLQDLSLRFYGHMLLHFIRWWSCQPGVDVMCFDPHQFTESTLLDYVEPVPYYAGSIQTVVAITGWQNISTCFCLNNRN